MQGNAFLASLFHRNWKLGLEHKRAQRTKYRTDWLPRVAVRVWATIWRMAAGICDKKTETACLCIHTASTKQDLNFKWLIEWVATYCGGNLWTQGQHPSEKSLRVVNDPTVSTETGDPYPLLCQSFPALFPILFMRISGPQFGLCLAPPFSENKYLTSIQTVLYRTLSRRLSHLILTTLGYPLMFPFYR